MYFKRFMQLFVIFLIASVILAAILSTNFTGNVILTFFVGLIVAYAVLTLPLVILTIAKANKKANIVGTKTVDGELSALLRNLPGYIALSVLNGEGKSSTTIMSFTQATKQENVFYMVADKEAAKVRDLKERSAVSFTTWFDNLSNGARLSSNRATAEVLEGAGNSTLLMEEPNILSVHENAANMAIIRLTVHSALYENFKDGLKMLNFEK